MAIEAFLEALDQLERDALQAFEASSNEEALEAARIEFLGAKNGRLKSVQKGLGAVPGPDKPAAGQRLNAVRARIDEAFQAAQDRIKAQAEQSASVDLKFDPTLPGAARRLGRRHPIAQTIADLVDIMGRLGFSLEDGPEIEDEWHNFDALNIPADHPARDPLENFYLRSEDSQILRLLRSQTSTVQIRVMEKRKPPIRIIALGRVYRPDTADPTHYPMFHQMEGLLIDSQVTMADLKETLRLFANCYLGEDVQVRFRPSFFPFTEPSVEVDFYWNGRWMEFGGAGMVDPNVLSAVGINPEEVSGFAFGLGVERLCMRRFGVTDIRDLYTNDVRFLRQF